MAVTITPTRQPLDATQQGLLRQLFDSPAFSLLKEVVVARCIEHQLNVTKALLYPDNPVAQEEVADEGRNATYLNAALDILDDLKKGEEEWYIVKLTPHS